MLKHVNLPISGPSEAVPCSLYWGGGAFPTLSNLHISRHYLWLITGKYHASTIYPSIHPIIQDSFLKETIPPLPYFSPSTKARYWNIIPATNPISWLLHPLWLIPERYHSLHHPSFLSSPITVAHPCEISTPHTIYWSCFIQFIMTHFWNIYPPHTHMSDLHSSTVLICGRYMIPQHHPSFSPVSPINWLIPLRYHSLFLSLSITDTSLEESNPSPSILPDSPPPLIAGHSWKLPSSYIIHLSCIPHAL